MIDVAHGAAVTVHGAVLVGFNPVSLSRNVPVPEVFVAIF